MRRILNAFGMALVLQGGAQAFAVEGVRDLSCNFHNGVTLRTFDESGKIVNAQLFGLQKDFEVRLDPRQVGDISMVILENKDAQYVIYMPLDRSLRRPQKARAEMRAPDRFVPKYYRFVSNGECFVEVVDERK